MVWPDRIIGSLLLLLALAYYWLTYGIEVGLASDLLGPTFFPRTLAILLVVASAALVVRSLRARRGEGEEPPPAGDAPHRLVWTLALTVAYLLLLPRAGYLLLTPVYLGAFAYLLGYRSWKPLVGTAVGVTVALYLIFGRMLGVRLPRGVLFD